MEEVAAPRAVVPEPPAPRRGLLIWGRPAAALLALACAAPLLAASHPFTVEAPPELRAEAERIAALDQTFLAPALELTGLPEAPPIRVALVPEEAPLAHRVPAWMSGFAEGSTGLVVLFPARAGYPDAGLEALLRHEACHVLLARASRYRIVPRWFDEGLALAAGREWGVEDRTRFAFALLRSAGRGGRELDLLFRGPVPDVRAGYAVAGALVRDLLERHGPRFPGRLLALVAADVDFDDAYRQATGTPLEVDLDAFWARHRSAEAWVAVLTSSTALWAAITLLAVWAMKVRRRRIRERLAQLAAEEASLPGEVPAAGGLEPGDPLLLERKEDRDQV